MARKLSTGTGGGSIGLAPMATGTGKSRGSSKVYKTAAKAQLKQSSGTSANRSRTYKELMKLAEVSKKMKKR